MLSRIALSRGWSWNARPIASGSARAWRKSGPIAAFGGDSEDLTRVGSIAAGGFVGPAGGGVAPSGVVLPGAEISSGAEASLPGSAAFGGGRTRSTRLVWPQYRS